MDHRVVVRTLGLADIPAYIALRREMLGDSPWAFSGSETDDVGLDPEFLQARLKEDGQVIVGAFEGSSSRLVGAAGAFRQRQVKMSHRAHVWGVYVSPAFRRGGTGRAILMELIKRVREWPGITSLGLSASELSAEARRMYEGLGFRAWGIEPGALVLNGRVVDEFHMVMELEPRERAFVLESERLGLRAWREEDLGLAVSLWGDPRVTRLIDSRVKLSEAEVNERLDREIAMRVASGVQYWAVFEKGGQFVGCGGLRPREGMLEFGAHLRPEFWGKGYATEVGRVVLGYAFGRLGAKEVFAGHHPENEGSRRMLERLGFRRVGEVLYPPTGVRHPSYLVGREDFARG